MQANSRQKRHRIRLSKKSKVQYKTHYRSHPKLTTSLPFYLLIFTFLTVALISGGLLFNKIIGSSYAHPTATNQRNVRIILPYQPQAHSPYNSMWKDNTVTLLEKTYQWDGSYNGNLTFTTQPLDPYTTYYTVMTYQTLNIPIINRDATINALQKPDAHGHHLCESPKVGQDDIQSNQLRCFYFTTSTLSALHNTSPNKQSIIQYLNSLQAQNGLYAIDTNSIKDLGTHKPGTSTDLGSTQMALTIFHMLGQQPSRITQLKSWLLAQWNNDAWFNNNTSALNTMDSLSTLAQCLQLIGIEVKNLPNASALLRWTEQFRSQVTDLHITKNTPPLTFLSNWLKLMNSLQKSLSHSHLLDSSYFDQLAIFQQQNGGFSAFLQQDNEDIQGTYLATTLFKENGLTIPNKEKITLLLHQQSLITGGYLPLLKTDASDKGSLNRASSTEVTLAIYDLLNQPFSATISSTQQQNYIHRNNNLLLHIPQPLSPIDENIVIQDTYNTILLANKLRFNISSLLSYVNQEATTFLSGLQDNQPLTNLQLTNAYYLSQMIQWSNSEANKLAQAILLLRSSSGAFVVNGFPPLESTWLATSTLQQLDIITLSADARQQTANWILQQQDKSGGYLETQNTPTVFASYWATQSLLVLDGKAMTDMKLLNWLHTLKQPHGGMLSQSDSQEGSSLFALYYALTITGEMHSSL